MTENIYTSFGSHIVLEPQDLLDDDKKNDNDPALRWRNLKLQLRYFTLQGNLEDATVNNAKCEKSAETINIVNNERIYVIESHSCDSFHSCQSSVSLKDFPKLSPQHGRKNRHRCGRTKPCDEEFQDQITVINAIFLNKKSAYNQFDVKNKNLSDKTNHSSSNNDYVYKSDQSSGDRVLIKDCEHFKFSSLQKETESTMPFQNIQDVHQEETTSFEGLEPTHEKLKNKPVIKPFKINRKAIFGTKKPVMTKIIGRKGHLTTLHKLHPFKQIEIKNSPTIILSDKTLDSKTELQKGVRIEVKEEVNEGYEIQFLEPIQLNNPIALVSENSLENCNIDGCHENEELNSQFKNDETDNSVNTFDKSCLQLFSKVQTSDSSISSKDSEESRLTCPRDDLSEQYNCDSELELIEEQDKLPDEQNEEINVSKLSNSETKLSDFSLNETFEIFFKNDGQLEKIDSSNLNLVSVEELIDENEIEKCSERKNINEEETEVTIEYFGKNANTGLTNRPCKRRRSSTRKNPLPVIEESTEPSQENLKSDLVDNDYCLVDTFGRSIHLFDTRGRPLTDSCGRPLRSAGGELLLKCDNHGIPVVDEDTQIFDLSGRQPHEEGFQPWMSPQIFRTCRLTLEDGRPLVLFDVEGKPLTSISGTMLVDSFGRSLVKLPLHHDLHN